MKFSAAGILMLFCFMFPLCVFADDDFFELCKTGSAEEIRQALSDGNSATGRNSDGFTPLMLAAGLNPNPEAVIALLSAGASVKERDEYGDTPLMFAVEYNQTAAVIETLIKKGASVKDKNQLDETPLLKAAEKNGNPEIVALLLKAGASVKDHRHDGCSALHLAARYNQSAEITALLLKAGASVNERVNSIDEDYTIAPNGVVMEKGTKELSGTPGWSPLLLAAWSNKNPEVIKTLIRAGASVNERFSVKIRVTPESGGALRELFGDHGKKDNAPNENLTPLMIAASNTDDPEVVTALLKAGADPKAKNRAGETAADMAKLNQAMLNTPAYWALKDALYK